MERKFCRDHGNSSSLSSWLLPLFLLPTIQSSHRKVPLKGPSPLHTYQSVPTAHTALCEYRLSHCRKWLDKPSREYKVSVLTACCPAALSTSQQSHHARLCNHRCPLVVWSFNCALRPCFGSSKTSTSSLPATSNKQRTGRPPHDPRHETCCQATVRAFRRCKVSSLFVLSRADQNVTLIILAVMLSAADAELQHPS